MTDKLPTVYPNGSVTTQMRQVLMPHVSVMRSDNTGFTIWCREPFSWRHPLRRVVAYANKSPHRLPRKRRFVTFRAARRWAWRESGYSFTWGPGV